SSIREDNVMLGVDLSNPDISDGATTLPRGVLHIYRSKFLCENVCYERLRVHNYGLAAVDSWMELLFDSDFADIFEVRGQQRIKRGQRMEDLVKNSGEGTSSVTLAYEGLDHLLRRMRIHCEAAGATVAPGHMCLPFHLEPGA